jgi:hypothetical protein
VDCVDFQFWEASEPIFFGPWEKVDSANLSRKQTKPVSRLDQAERWLVGES